jgi:hypothetical protein
MVTDENEGDWTCEHTRPELFGLPVETDETIPPGTALFKDADGNIVGMVTGLR